MLANCNNGRNARFNRSCRFWKTTSSKEGKPDNNGDKKVFMS